MRVHYEVGIKTCDLIAPVKAAVKGQTERRRGRGEEDTRRGFPKGNERTSEPTSSGLPHRLKQRRPQRGEGGEEGSASEHTESGDLSTFCSGEQRQTVVEQQQQ